MKKVLALITHGFEEIEAVTPFDLLRRAGAELTVAALGAGEILLTSMDCDGVKTGYDLELTRRVSEAVGVPVVASGGAGTLGHMVDAVKIGKASAVLAASIFHFGTYSIREAKEALRAAGLPARL